MSCSRRVVDDHVSACPAQLKRFLHKCQHHLKFKLSLRVRHLVSLIGADLGIMLRCSQPDDDGERFSVMPPLEQISGLTCMPSRFIIAKTSRIYLVIMLRILHHHTTSVRLNLFTCGTSRMYPSTFQGSPCTSRSKVS
jgi:hypothetical protein